MIGKDTKCFCTSIETVTRRCSVKDVFLKISQNSQEKNLCQILFFNKVAGLSSATLLKEDLAQELSCEFRKISKKFFSYKKVEKTLQHRCFPVNFEKLLRTTFLAEHLLWLLLQHVLFIYVRYSLSHSDHCNIGKTFGLFHHLIVLHST